MTFTKGAMREQVCLSKMEHCGPPMQTPARTFTCLFNGLLNQLGRPVVKPGRAVPDRYIGLKSCD
jgi:hypothetical protein